MTQYGRLEGSVQEAARISGFPPSAAASSAVCVAQAALLRTCKFAAHSGLTSHQLFPTWLKKGRGAASIPLDTCLADHATHKANSQHTCGSSTSFSYQLMGAPAPGVVEWSSFICGQGYLLFQLISMVARVPPRCRSKCEDAGHPQQQHSRQSQHHRSLPGAALDASRVVANQSTSPAPVQPISALAPHLTASRYVICFTSQCTTSSQPPCQVRVEGNWGTASSNLTLLELAWRRRAQQRINLC